MAYKVGQVLLELKADTAKLVSGMDRAEKSIYKLKRSFADLVKAAAAIYGVTKAFQILNSVIIETSAKFEKFSLILETLEGSSKKAQQDLEWIKKFAQTTPYEIDKVTEAFVKLKSYGLNAQKELRVLGDTAAALGKPLNMAVEAIADAVTGEFERLKEFGVKAYQQGDKVAFTWADASGKARYIVVDNNREIIESTLTAIWNSKYQGAMEKLSNSWDGILSNMSDSWTNFKAETSSLAFKEAKKDLLVMQKVWNSTLNDMKQPMADFETTVVKGFKKVVLGAAIVDDGISDLIGLILHFGKGLLYSFDELAYSIPAKIETLINGIIDVINSAPDFIKKAFGGDLQHLNTYSNLTQTYSKVASKEFSEAWKYASRIAKGEIGDVYKYWKQNFDKAEKEVEKNAVKVAKTTKEIGTVGQFNRDLLKNEKEIKENAKDYEDYTTRILKNKQAEVDITNKLIKQSKELVKTISDLEDDPYKRLKIRYEDYLNKIQSDTVLNEKQKAALKLKVDKWYNKELQKLNKQTLEKLQNEYKDYLNENYKLFLTTLDDVNNTLETDFFDALKGKFHSFSDFLKNLFKDVGDSIYNSLAKSISGSIADYLTGSVKKAVVPSFASFVGVDNFAKELGLSLNDEGKYVGKINGKEVIVNSSGDIEKGADVIKQKFGLSDLSNLKDIYQISDKYFPEISAALSDVSAGFQTWMSGQALVTPSATANTLNAALMGSEYGQGLATSAWSKAGYYGGGALAGAGIGYGIGTIGDMLFGTDTKAGTYGAIGGAIGSLAGPIGGIIGGAIGSVIGGMFGSKKVTSTGIYVPDSAYFGSNNLHKYEKWEKKGWTGSSSGVDIKGKVSAAVQEYFNSRFKQFDLIIEELFNNPSQLTIPHGRYKENENNPNLTRMILHQFFKTLGMSDDFVKYTRDKLVRLWEDYAKGLNKAATDAVIEAFGNVLKAKRNFEVWLAQLKGDSLKSLQLQAQYAQKDLEFLKKEYGETELTVDNYLDLMNKAIENSPTPETINKWLELGDALQEATNAQEALKDAIKSEIDKGKAVYENALSLFDNKAITNTKELLEAINNAKPEDTQRILNAINTLKQKELKSVQDNYNTRIEQLQKEKEYLQNISDIVTRLKNIASDLILSTASDKYYLKAKFNEYLLRVRTDLQNGINPQNDVENLNTYAKSYANYLKQNAYSKQEYLFEVTKMANKINDLANKYNTKDGFKRVEEAIKQANIDLKTSIEKIDSTYKNYSNLLKLTIEQQYKEYLTTTINKYEQYLGEESPIIKKLQEIKNTLNKQIEETKQKVKGGGNFAPQGSVDKTKEAGQHTSSNVLTRAGLSFTPDVTKTSEVTASAFLTDGLVSPKDYVANLYTRFLGRKPDTEGLNAWAKQAEHVKTITDARKLQKAFISEAKKHGEEIKATYFADGGIVTKPTIGLIGEAGYSEAVIPLKNPNDPMNMNELKEEIRTLKEEIVKLREENRKYQSAIVENTAPIKNSQRYA